MGDKLSANSSGTQRMTGKISGKQQRSSQEEGKARREQKLRAEEESARQSQLCGECDLLFFMPSEFYYS